MNRQRKRLPVVYSSPGKGFRTVLGAYSGVAERSNCINYEVVGTKFPIPPRHFFASNNSDFITYSIPTSIGIYKLLPIQVYERINLNLFFRTRIGSLYSNVD